MANYLIALKTDSIGKKFLQVISDNGGNNEFIAIQGGEPVNQNGELVAPMEISSASLAALLGALSDQLPETLSNGGLRITPTDFIGIVSAQLPAALVDGKLSVQSAQLPATLVDGKLSVQSAQLPATLVDGKLPVTALVPGNTNTVYVKIEVNGSFSSNPHIFLLGLWIVTSGVVTIKDTHEAIILDGAPVTAGQFIQITDFYVDNGILCVFSSGASGTVLCRFV